MRQRAIAPARVIPGTPSVIASTNVSCFSSMLVLMEYNQGDRPVPYMPEFLECRNGKVWPNDRPGLGVRTRGR